MKTLSASAVAFLCLLPGAYSFAKSPFTAPSIIDSIKREGLEMLVLKKSRDGKIIYLDCDPRYVFDNKTQRYIPVERISNYRGVTCIYDSNKGIIKYIIPFNWKSIDNPLFEDRLRKRIMKFKGRDVKAYYPIMSWRCKVTLETRVFTSDEPDVSYIYSYHISVGKTSKRKFLGFSLESQLYKPCKKKECAILYKGLLQRKPGMPLGPVFLDFSLAGEGREPGLSIPCGQRPDRNYLMPGEKSTFVFGSDYPPAIDKAGGSCGSFKDYLTPELIMVGPFAESLHRWVPGRLAAYSLVPSREMAGLDAVSRLGKLIDDLAVMRRAGWLRASLTRQIKKKLAVLLEKMRHGAEIEKELDRVVQSVTKSTERQCSTECKSYLGIHSQLIRSSLQEGKKKVPSQ